ncbi:MAG TPA: cadherin-like beta sandwich domain-containing protein, partial [Chitinispirillaceae bacterium]|nr:cadherin-like beta sandwich domain-containing protein [Chitinispirillaceae bacterium]
YAEAGCDAVLSAGIYSGKNIFLRERAVINGDAIASESIHKQNNVVISGIERDHAQIDFPVLETKTVTFGTLDTIAGNGSSFVLTPGDYRDFQAFSNSVITIMPGEYSFRKFLIEPDVQIVLNVSEGETIEFNIGEEIRLADRTVMSFESGSQLPLSFRVYSAQTSQLFIGNDAQIYGLFTAPLSEIHVYSRTNLNGALYGRRVVVEPESEVCKPPVLTGLTHSQIAMAPEFNPLTFSYTAIVPDATATILVIPSVFDSTTVTVNGNPPDTLVNLTSTENAISILLNSPEACGTTEYELNVTKSANYMIHVNADSPCTPGSEDGNSWSTAFKDLQQAIDTALVRGKEIWVAEGEYRPSKLTTESDSGSATFLIKPGIVIKGGFDGTEITDEPSGSVYNTILTGDLAGNDDSLSTWPPSESDSVYLNDNVYHVVTMDGYEGSTGVKLLGVTITGGAANGENENSFGGAIYCKNVNPALSNCVFTHNLAKKSGGALYCQDGLGDCDKILFEKNLALDGSGGALFIDGGTDVKLKQFIFIENHSKGDTLISLGGALYVNETELNFENSIFYGNRSDGPGSAIYCSNSSLSMINNTLSGNFSESSGGCVYLHESDATILNNIHWNNGLEISGDSVEVTYSIIDSSFSGTGNIHADPKFLEPGNPVGDDKIWGTNDDGLRLSDESPATGNSCDSFPELDIAETYRVPNDSGKNDMGAYIYVYPDIGPDIDGDAVLGYFKNSGEFVLSGDVHVYSEFDSKWGYILARNSNRVLYARILVDDKKQTRKISGGPVTISAHDSTGAKVYSKVIQAKRAEDNSKINGKLVYYTEYPIMFMQDTNYVEQMSEVNDNDSLFFMYGNAYEVSRFVITAYTNDYR